MTTDVDLPADPTVSEILAHTRRIWEGQPPTRPATLLPILAKVVGDIAEIVRTADETGVLDTHGLQRELGNLGLSWPRLAADLGLDPAACLVVAEPYQRAYAARLREQS